VLAKFGNQLSALGNGQARIAMSRALNHEGDKGRTQVKRALAKQMAAIVARIGHEIGRMLTR
jgi:hypothetical protein